VLDVEPPDRTSDDDEAWRLLMPDKGHAVMSESGYRDPAPSADRMKRPAAPPAGDDPFTLEPSGAIVMAVLTVIAPLFAGVNDLGEPATIPTTGPARSVR
jgi:hypothetical protein